MNSMKHTLLALAALTAAAGASAQNSSVTLFGVLDASVAHLSSSTNSVTGLSNGGNSSSRLGFRGVEDLGGGLKAGFWLEAGVTVDNGSASGLKFDRRSTLSLMGDFGELRLGRDKSPAYMNIETFDPFGDAGVGGNGGSNLIGSASSAAGTAEGSAPKRLSNGVNYLLPKMGGFYGQVQYAFGEKVENSRLGSGMAIRVGYGAGPLNVALGHGRMRGGTAAAGVDYKSTNIGASYDLGMVKPMALFATERGNGKRMDLFGLGATMPVGAAGELRVAYTQIKNKNVSDADTQKFAIGYSHKMSKRTRLYGTVARVSNDDNAKRGFAVSSSSLAGPTIANGDNATGYEIGIRHNF